jgi:beta-glucanase (GH16 family)
MLATSIPAPRLRHARLVAPMLVLALLAGLLVTPSGAAPAAAAPAAGAPGILADLEDGPPPGFFVFSGGASTVTPEVVLVDAGGVDARPGQEGANGILEVEYDVGDFGGFGQAFEADGPQSWVATEGFRMWFKGDGSGASYTIELSGARSNPATDTSTRYNTTFVDDTTGWRLVELRWEAFALSAGFQPGGAPLDPELTLDEIWAWAIVLPGGTGRFLLDDVGVQPIRADDLEYDGLPGGTDGSAAIGFSTFQDASSSVAIALASAPDAPTLPHLGSDNRMLRMDLNVTAFAGFAHAFTDGTSWISQDWSTSSSFGFWFHGQGDGTTIFVDVLGARNPGSSVDDAQRWTVEFADDHAGWSFRSWPFEALRFKPIGNGAPGGVGDTFDPSVVHGWAVGALATGGDVTFHVDELVRFGSAEDRPLTVGLASTETRVTEGGTAAVAVRLSRPLRDGEDPVEVGYRTEPGSAVPGRTYDDAQGTLVFEAGGPTELTFEVTTYDDTKRNHDRTVIVRLDGPADLLRTAQGWITIVDDEVTDPALLDDVEQTEHEFDPMDAELARIELAEDDARARPDQDRFEGVLEVAVDDLGDAAGGATTVSIDPETVSIRGACQGRGDGVVQVVIHGSEELPVTAIDHTTIRVGDAREINTDPRTGEPRLRVRDVDRDGFDDLIVHVRLRETGLSCATLVGEVTATVGGTAPTALGGVARSWADARDLSGAEAISFWFEGTGSGEEHTFRLRDNAAPDPGPDGWELVWSDEFDQPEGTPPDPANWSFELGDGTVNQIPGWGNDELQYYTDAPENVRHDGEGNLIIEVLELDGGEDGPTCYYGPCRYTSARLISQYKQEFLHGRIEARVQVPEGDGLWPAFWALGTDIPEVGWPQTGEIDIMEVVGRLPSTVFGTIHGPGYAGGQSFGGTTSTAPDQVADDVRTFAVEWQPGEIVWEFDGERFFTATPDDVAPNEWVFEHPFFLLLNVAVGGNFGGAVGPDTTFPQRMSVEYVRAYGAPDTAERFEAVFTDDVAGWQRVTIPFSELVRSDEQPEGAPDDGLTLTGARGYEILGPAGTTFRIDDVRLTQPEEVTVTSAADGGPGSLRSALSATAAGGTIGIDPALAGETVALASPLAATRSVTIDVTEAPGFTLDAGGTSRVLEVGPGADVTLLGGTVTGGSHALQGGAIRVAGTLRLEDVTVIDNRTRGGSDFDHGGGAMYATENARLEVIGSRIVDNTSAWAGGAVWAGFGSQVTITDSEVTGNLAADVGGALRTLGTLDVTGSTFTGNRSTGWYGGALFVTDGVATVRASTFGDNPGADGANASLFVGTFSDAAASLVLGGNEARNAGGEVCFVAPFGSGAVSIVSEGGNTFGDATCNPGPDDAVEP